jgi:hypothetical protein
MLGENTPSEQHERLTESQSSRPRRQAEREIHPESGNEEEAPSRERTRVPDEIFLNRPFLCHEEDHSTLDVSFEVSLSMHHINFEVFHLRV